MGRNENPKALILTVVILWIIFCAVIFTNAPDLTIGEKLLFAVMSLWIFMRVGKYKGRYYPRIVYAVRILWLPMLALFLFLHLTGKM